MTIAVTDAAAVCRQIDDDLRQVAELFDSELRSADDRPEVAELCEHLGRFRGKMLRPALLLLTARATGKVKPIHRCLAAVIEMFHLATLVHDDVLDDAAIRRDTPTINRGWGNQAAIMLGDWLISHAYHLCSRQGSQWASLEISATAHRVCQGELLQLVLAGRGDLSISADDYMEIVSRKTAALMGLAARFGARFNDAGSPIEQACLDYGLDLGIAFQIIDDVLDLVGDERTVGKTLRSDLAEGKATLPLIHFLRSADPVHAERIRKLLNGHPGGVRPDHAVQQADPDRPARLEQARQIIVSSGCIDSARAVACRHAESAKAQLACLPASEARDSLAALADFAVARSR